jgi:hypothetical protein
MKRREINHGVRDSKIANKSVAARYRSGVMIEVDAHRQLDDRQGCVRRCDTASVTGLVWRRDIAF